jgi:hypothetical protein
VVRRVVVMKHVVALDPAERTTLRVEIVRVVVRPVVRDVARCRTCEESYAT